jgi:ubiquitin carboxyl-terminal hydrolase 40
MAAYGVSDTNTEYELYGIVIHRGSAHGGHYFAYVRDVLGESSWKENLEGLNKKKEEEKKEEEQKKS